LSARIMPTVFLLLLLLVWVGRNFLTMVLTVLWSKVWSWENVATFRKLQPQRSNIVSTSLTKTVSLYFKQMMKPKWDKYSTFIFKIYNHTHYPNDHTQSQSYTIFFFWSKWLVCCCNSGWKRSQF
jgi:hypothetical protein